MRMESHRGLANAVELRPLAVDDLRLGIQVTLGGPEVFGGHTWVPGPGVSVTKVQPGAR